jgi:hypothetical protein
MLQYLNKQCLMTDSIIYHYSSPHKAPVLSTFTPSEDREFGGPRGTGALNLDNIATVL